MPGSDKPTSRIAPTVDFDASGMQHGFLKLPHSTHESAYGWIPIPVTVAACGVGPTVLLLAGIHGDEYEGQIAAMKILRSINAAEIQGRIIILPAANFPAVMAGRRVSPIDDGNLNRAFPGEANGTPTQIIAHFIESAILPMCDQIIDLHSGGSSLDYVPHAHARRHTDPEICAKTVAAIAAFGAPYGGLVKPLQGEPRTMSAAAERNNVVYINVELGGGGTVSRELVAMAEAGIRRVLAHLGVLPAAHRDDRVSETRYFNIGGAENYLYCMENGVFEPLVGLRDHVAAGQPAGAIHFPDTPWRKEIVMTFARDGFVLCRRFPGWARRGDCLYQLASLEQGP